MEMGKMAENPAIRASAPERKRGTACPESETPDNFSLVIQTEEGPEAKPNLASFL